MSDSPLFTTIIATFNRAELIGQTLDSVLDQSCNDQEIIVVDDGSTDRTQQVLANYGNRIKVLQQPNRGPGAARNLGIENAAGRYITLIDSDDLWLPWTLTTYKQVIDDFNEPAFIASHTRAFSKDLPQIHQDQLRVTSYADYYTSSADAGWVPLCGVAVRADAMRQVGCFAEHRYNFEETDLWLRLGTSPGFVRIESPCCSARREHDQRVTVDMTRSVRGVQYLIQQEKNGRYPGSAQRRSQRLEMLTRHLRPVSLECAISDGVQLYRESFAWHVTLGRWRYLLGFPFMARFRRNR